MGKLCKFFEQFVKFSCNINVFRVNFIENCETFLGYFGRNFRKFWENLMKSL